MTIAASLLLLAATTSADPSAPSNGQLAELLGFGGKAEAARVEQDRAIEKDLAPFAETFEIEGCSEASGGTDCRIRALRLPASALSRCDTPMFVNETVIDGEARKSAASIAMIRLRPVTRRTRDGRVFEIPSRRPVDTLAVVLKDNPGIHNECIGGTLSTDSATYEIVLADDRKASLGSALVGGLIGGIRPVEPRTIFGALACTLTGCEERRSIAVTVRGGGRKLPIFIGGNATRFWTDETFNMPLRALPSLSVRDEEGRSVPVSTCRLYDEARHSRVYHCSPPKKRADPLGLSGRQH